jgi:hypothetical protein
MTSVRYWHRRILAGRRGGDPEAARIYPHYMSFESGLRPEWWTDETPEDWGAVLGVHECTVGQEAGGIVVTEKGLAVLGHPWASARVSARRTQQTGVSPEHSSLPQLISSGPGVAHAPQ